MTQFKNSPRRLALTTSALTLAFAMASAPAFAQQTAAAEEAAADEAIVVTGSRIARRDLDTPAPLAVVSGVEFKNFGAVNVESIINTLPQVVPGTTAFSNNPGGGVATLNLRGLGATRTSVLVNGRRWMFYSTNQVVDLNTIPQFLLEGVETITGGASAVYGSDAIAGVVNFKLKNLEGFQANVTQSLTERGDGNRLDMNVAFGGSFGDGRGHATVYASYYNRKPVFQGERPFSATAFADNATATGFTSGGSAATPAGRLAVAASNTFLTPGTPTSTICDALGATQPAGCNVLPLGVGAFGTSLGGTFDSTTASARPFSGATDLYNYAPVNYLMVPQERYLFGGYADYEITKGVTAYTEVSYVQNNVRAQLAATPVTGTFNVRLATVAPFLSAADNTLLQQIDANETAINAARAAAGLTGNAATLYSPTGANAIANGPGVIAATINRRVTDINARINNDERSAFRVLFGLRGDIGSGWNYDAYYSFARTRNSNIQEGNVSRSAFQRGLDGTAGAVALDIFGENSLSPAMASAISIIAQNTTVSTLEVAQANVGGPLFNLGWGGGDVAVNGGFEYRRVTSQFIPDTALSSGDVIGFNATNPTRGGYHAKEVFGEIIVPIAADQPFFQRLEVTAAGRYSDYNLPTVGGVWTYAVGAQWSPIKDITFRGQYSRAVRAPNVGELFGGGGIGFPTATDPCTTAAALAAGPLRNTCIGTGVPAANLGQGIPSALQPNTQLQARTGGNPNLNAEQADTWTAGVVLKPSFIPRLSITVDYFNIEIGNAVATAGGGAANILNLCFNTFQDPTNGFCQLINRNDSTGALDGSTNPDGTIASIFAGVANLSSLKTRGFDIGVDYTIPLQFGLFGNESRVNLNFLGSIYQRNTFTPVLGINNVIECAGFFGARCGTPQGKFQSQSRLTWMDGNMTTNVRWRYLAAVKDDNDAVRFVVERIPAYSLFDLSFNYDVTDNVAITAGINNLFDKKPPIIGTNQEQANTYAGVYDVLGRDFFISVGFRF
ncbi:TonB-dependent receptor [Sandarakinorhabdus sp. AAP62]|uniref:TonB-dependent receptor domain-containing protein n=1 Tax=Sandarakinorhabdus sp. AAP62 TaxID=1248916 RepID=UPI0002FFAB29|nr:TonB-dependent receptor [Sandarakinorhabdus sp. AAP62]